MARHLSRISHEQCVWPVYFHIQLPNRLPNNSISFTVNLKIDQMSSNLLEIEKNPPTHIFHIASPFVRDGPNHCTPLCRRKYVDDLACRLYGGMKTIFFVKCVSLHQRIVSKRFDLQCWKRKP
jgi:hypothetical protein